MSWNVLRGSVYFAVVVGTLLLGAGAVFADEAPAAATASDQGTTELSAEPTEEAKVPTRLELTYAIDNVVLFIAAVLVILMQPGFALLEVGLNAAKNATNILFKNFMDLAVGVLLFFAVGYGLMYPGDSFAGKWFGFGGFAISEAAPPELAPGTLNPQVSFLFQVAFAATAATIVSGAVAGRMRFVAYLIYSAVITGLVYPISGMWTWGGGWLGAAGFHDFAGSVIVHSVGGSAALAGAIVLGPRLGRFSKGKSAAMPGHNLAFATLGVFILWVGWYGFNPGSQLAFAGQANTDATMKIAVNTTLAAASGAVVSMLVAWGLFKKPDLTMALNGALAGLVGITANCDLVTNAQSLIIGAVAGVLVIAGILLLDKLHIDDPVGAWPVHGLCGAWGGIATGVFVTEVSLVTQIKGTLIIAVWAFATLFALFVVLRLVGLLRVSQEDEIMGLDISEHGMHAYPPSLVVDTYTAPSGHAHSASAGNHT